MKIKTALEEGELANLIRLTSDIEVSRESNQSLIVAFLDVKSAYNNVRMDLLYDILYKQDCPEKIVSYIVKWMRDRVTKFSIGDDQEDIRLVNKGLPQRGVLSPTLYNVYTSELSKSVKNNIRMIRR